jgi:sulfur carrier protein ThiS
MRVRVNSREQELPPGSRLARVVELVRETRQDDPVTRALIERTGFDHLTVVYNGRVVRPHEYESIELQEGDEIGWMRPYAGG